MPEIPPLLSPPTTGRLKPAFDMLMQHGNLKNLQKAETILAKTIINCERDALWEAYHLLKCLTRRLAEPEYDEFKIELEYLLECHVSSVQSCDIWPEVRDVIKATVETWRDVEDAVKMIRRERRAVSTR